MPKEICVLVSPVPFLWLNKVLTFWTTNQWLPETVFTSYVRSTAQLHSDSGLNSEHHTTGCPSAQLVACYKDSSSLLNIDLNSHAIRISIHCSLVTSLWYKAHMHTHMHAYRYCAANSSVQETSKLQNHSFLSFLISAVLGVCLMAKIFFWLQLQITLALALLGAWTMQCSVDEQLLNVTFFPPHLVALILHRPNPLPRAILFISSWANKWALQIITRRCKSFYSHQWICSHIERARAGEAGRKQLDFHMPVPISRCLEHVFRACHIGKYYDQRQIFSKSNFPSITELNLQRTRTTSVTLCAKSTYLQFPPRTQNLLLFRLEVQLGLTVFWITFLLTFSEGYLWIKMGQENKARAFTKQSYKPLTLVTPDTLAFHTYASQAPALPQCLFPHYYVSSSQ